MSSGRIETALGEIDIEIFEKHAPASAGYFLADVRAGRYDGSSFFRIVTPTNQNAEEGRRVAVIQGGLKHARDDLPRELNPERGWIATATDGALAFASLLAVWSRSEPRSSPQSFTSSTCPGGARSSRCQTAPACRRCRWPARRRARAARFRHRG